VVENQAMGAHGGVESFFARVAEGGMAEIVHQRESFGEIDIEMERGCDRTRDLRDLDGVGEAVAEMVGVAAGKNLSLGFETAKGAGVDDAVAVTLKIVAVRMGRLRDAASAGLLYMHRVACQHGKSLAECGYFEVGLAAAVPGSMRVFTRFTIVFMA
jgi:hypothetical protein